MLESPPPCGPVGVPKSAARPSSDDVAYPCMTADRPTNAHDLSLPSEHTSTSWKDATEANSNLTMSGPDRLPMATEAIRDHGGPTRHDSRLTTHRRRARGCWFCGAWCCGVWESSGYKRHEPQTLSRCKSAQSHGERTERVY